MRRRALALVADWPPCVELIFRKHFWVVHLLFIFLAALLVARIINSYVEVSISPLPAERARSMSMRPADAVAPLQLSLEKLAALTI